MEKGKTAIEKLWSKPRGGFCTRQGLDSIKKKRKECGSRLEGGGKKKKTRNPRKVTGRQSENTETEMQGFADAGGGPKKLRDKTVTVWKKGGRIWMVKGGETKGGINIGHLGGKR